jgi:hypothetical protein
MNRKRLLTLAVIGFAVFFIITRPVEAATVLRETAQGTAEVATTAAEAFSTFLTTLF